jgi:periplasmic divalent cation tolerance protein
MAVSVFWDKNGAMEKAEDQLVLSVVTTLGSPEDARSLARKILDARLAACVQMEPGISSHYRWKGAVCEDTEVRLTIKTLARHAGALQALFAAEHPYALPQFLATPMSASPAYANWVRQEVA